MLPLNLPNTGSRTSFGGSRAHRLNAPLLYPLRFVPVFQYRLWGGRRLGDLLATPLPGTGPIGEAWILSDRDDYPSKVAGGPLKDRTLGQIMDQFPEQLMGSLAYRFTRFPLLLKFLDVRRMLSVQVHPGDDQSTLLAPGESGKTEAWVVLQADAGSKIYDGLRPGTTLEGLRHSLSIGTLSSQLVYRSPKVGDTFFTPAGTVHSLGDGVVVFEIQQNSDVTFRLDDWGHIDPATGQPRPLQVQQALASVRLQARNAGLVEPSVQSAEPVQRQRLLCCEHFIVSRLEGCKPFPVGHAHLPRVLVCLQGSGAIHYGDAPMPVAKGQVWLLPAVIGIGAFHPSGPVTLLEIAIPESDSGPQVAAAKTKPTQETKP
jgi:mannose-6-phosphate isomerase